MHFDSIDLYTPSTENTEKFYIRIKPLGEVPRKLKIYFGGIRNIERELTVQQPRLRQTPRGGRRIAIKISQQISQLLGIFFREDEKKLFKI